MHWSDRGQSNPLLALLNHAKSITFSVHSTIFFSHRQHLDEIGSFEMGLSRLKAASQTEKFQSSQMVRLSVEVSGLNISPSFPCFN